MNLKEKAKDTAIFLAQLMWSVQITQVGRTINTMSVTMSTAPMMSQKGIWVAISNEHVDQISHVTGLKHFPYR